MKKTFTKFMLLLFALVVGCSNAWADTFGFSLASTSTVPLAANANPQTTTITGTASETWDVEITGTWKSSSMQGSPNYIWQMGAKDKAITSAIFSTTGKTGTITSIVVNCSSYQGKAKVRCTVGGSNFGVQNQSTASWTSTGDVTFNGSASGAIVVTIDNSASGARAAYIRSITVTYSSSPTISITDPSAFPATSGNGTLNVSYANISPSTGSYIKLYSDDDCTEEITGSCWFTPSFKTSAKGTDYSKIDYTYSENSGTPYAARTVYMKVTLSTSSKAEVTSSKVTISQKRYYTVTFDGNGGQTAGSATTYTQNISEGATAPLTANQFINGVNAFKHWNTEADDSGDDSYNNGADFTISSADVTLYAIWAPSYSVTYYANDGTSDNIVNNYAEGTDVTIASNTFTAPANRMFVKWYTKSIDDGTGISYNPGDEIENIGANYTLYAIWANKCALTLNSNGMTTTFNVPQGYEYDFPTPVNVPEGYTYKGWSTNPSTASEGVYNFTPDESTATFYAVFGIISYGNFILVTSAPDDWSGRYLIVYNNTYVLKSPYAGKDANTYGTYDNISAHYNSSGTYITNNSTTLPYAIKASKTTNGYSLYDESDKAYLGNNTATNAGLRWDSNFTTSVDEWTLGVGSIVNCYNTDREIRWNNNSGQYRFATYTGSQQAIQLFKLAESISGYTTTITSPTIPGNVSVSIPTEISATQTFKGNLTITAPLTISGTAVVTVEGDITNANVSNLIIEDGGQLIVNNSGVKAIVKKALPEATSSKDENWTTISSPVKNISIGDTDEDGNVTHLKDVAYALYRLNETTSEWENYKNGAYHDGEDGDDFEILEAGRGYLYSRTSLATLEYVGEVNGDEYTEYTLTMSGNKISGFHLIGNPYSHDIYKGAAGNGYAIPNTAETGYDNPYVLATGFYQLKNGTSWLPKLDDGTKIEKGEGILVQATTAGTLRIYNSATAPAPVPAKSNTINHDNIMFTVANGQNEDAAYALFDKGMGLSKINHRDNVTPMIYIEQKGEDYAIATMSDDTKSFNLNFKAMTTGQYTLSYKANGDFNYLHVIDRLTGEDVDMLLEGEYKFIGTPSDKDNRFIVKLGYMPDYSDADNEIFAYQSGSDILVSGTGELQIFDVTGRQVMTTTINGAESISVPAQGVYIFRLVGNEIKTQKIVVR